MGDETGSEIKIKEWGTTLWLANWDPRKLDSLTKNPTNEIL